MAVLTEAIEAEGEAGAMTVTGAALVATATVMITVRAVTTIEVEDVLARDPDPRTTTDTIDPVAVLDGTTVKMIDPPPVGIRIPLPVQSGAAGRQTPNSTRMSVTSVPSLSSNLQPG
jgi:hypothetical protein